MKPDVSHNEIYDRLIAVEAKVDKVAQDTVDVVTAFHAAQGAFVVLDWVAKAAKPILWVAGVVATFSLLISEYRK
jgi:hypothetical protein